MSRKKAEPPTEGTPEPKPEAAPPKGEWRQMKPNKLFPPEITFLIRGYVSAKGETLPPCPVCQSKKRGRWTMLCPFRAYTLGQFAVQPGGTFAPLTLVCNEHPINPTEEIMKAL